MLTVVIPANNEGAMIGDCLAAVYAQTVAGDRSVIVAANGCDDDTVAQARATGPAAAAAGWTLTVLDLPEGGKPGALNAADAAAAEMEEGDVRIYLDADVRPDPALFAELADALAAPKPLYASGALTVAPAQSWVTRAYARIWRRLPFMTEGVPGAGLFAVNAAGRARWGVFPPIISDDTYVRLSFTPEERVGVAASFTWPMVEGFANIRRVRRRQNEGVEEVNRLYPDLVANNDPARLSPFGALRLALTDPVGFAVYIAMTLAVKRDMAKGVDGAWTRGR